MTKQQQSLIITILKMYNSSKRLFHTDCFKYGGVLPYVVAIAAVAGLKSKELKELLDRIERIVSD